jgi:hypothetical protein
VPKIVKSSPVAKKIIPKKKGGVLSRISDVELPDAVSMLIYGGSGTGKTRTVSTFPGKILHIICSGGAQSGELRSVSLEARKKIKQIRPENGEEALELMAMLKEDSGSTYNTVVLDHVSGFQDLILAEVLGRPVPAQKSWGLCTREQWGICSGRCKSILRELLDLPINRVILGQEKTGEPAEDSELEVPYVGVALIPTLSGWLYPECDYICQTFKRGRRERIVTKLGKGDKAVEKESWKRLPGVEYCARIGPHSEVTTKWRVPEGCELPDYIVNPTYDKFMEVINGNG